MGLHPSTEGASGLRATSTRLDASSASGRLIAQALVASHPSRSGELQTARLLPGGIYVPFQSSSARSRRLLFYRLLTQAVITAPVTYQHVAATKSKNTSLHGRPPAMPGYAGEAVEV